MTVTEPELNLDSFEARWGNPDKGIMSTLYTEEQLARQSTEDVPALIAEVRRLRDELAAGTAVAQENAALRQANQDARGLIKELHEKVAALEAAQTEGSAE